MALTPESVVQRNREVVGAPVQGELILMTLEEGAYFGTDAVGVWLWEQLAEPHIGHLCERLQTLYAVDPATCRQDVLAFLEDALANGLLVSVD